MTRANDEAPPPARAPRGHVLFLGTGDAFNRSGRGSQCIWVEPSAGPPFLVDAGPTALAAAATHGADLSRVDAVFITHLHGDHIGGWPFLVLRAIYLDRRTRPLRVIGPPGTRERLEALAHACYDEAIGVDARTFPIDYVELERSSSRGIEAGRGLLFDTEPLDHHPSSIGYRFHVDGCIVGVSGDTRWCPELERLGRGCDILILECTCLRKPDFAHVSLEEVRGGRERLGAKRVVLVHLEDAVARALDEEPIRGVIAARDGLAVPLAAPLSGTR